MNIILMCSLSPFQTSGKGTSFIRISLIASVKGIYFSCTMCNKIESGKFYVYIVLREDYIAIYRKKFVNQHLIKRQMFCNRV